MRDIINTIVAFILATISIALLSRGCGSEAPRASDTVRISDTVTIRDTMRIATPVAVASNIIRREQVTLPVVAPLDTVNPDSAAVLLPIEQRHYSGDNFDAWVSGYRPTLDSLHIYTPTTTITTTQTIAKPPPAARRWGLSVGVGAAITPQARIEPAIFVGVSYTFISF